MPLKRMVGGPTPADTLFRTAHAAKHLRASIYLVRARARASAWMVLRAPVRRALDTNAFKQRVFPCVHL